MFPPAMNEGSFFSTTSPVLVISCLVDNGYSNRYKVASHYLLVKKYYFHNYMYHITCAITLIFELFVNGKDQKNAVNRDKCSQQRLGKCPVEHP